MLPQQANKLANTSKTFFKNICKPGIAIIAPHKAINAKDHL
tara:strand:- start:176 stop:298 length:123 start_codon:yes stop_codon:yes gene_type:complete